MKPQMNRPAFGRNQINSRRDAETQRPDEPSSDPEFERGDVEELYHEWHGGHEYSRDGCDSLLTVNSPGAQPA